MSFLVNPFASNITLHKPYRDYKVDYLNGLVLDNAIEVVEGKNGNNISWFSFIDFGKEKERALNSFYTTYQKYTAGALASHKTDAVPAVNLNFSRLDELCSSTMRVNEYWNIHKTTANRIGERASQT